MFEIYLHQEPKKPTKYKKKNNIKNLRKTSFYPKRNEIIREIKILERKIKTEKSSRSKKKRNKKIKKKNNSQTVTKLTNNNGSSRKAINEKQQKKKNELN